MQTKYAFMNILRALRLPFLTASVFPFVFGSLVGSAGLDYLLFMLGLIAVMAMHSSSNLINDYFDSKSGADWQDKKFYGFFGGSKLIQEGIFTESQYFIAAVISAILGLICIAFLSVYLKSLLPLLVYLAVIILGWQYSGLPLKFAYRGLGEVIIFLLFGPALVTGAYFIQRGILPGFESFILSLPFGFLTLAILISNEIADAADDKIAGKHTWVVCLNEKHSYLLYFILILLGFISILYSIYLKFLGIFALAVLFFVPLVIKSGLILKNNFQNKMKLCESSRIAIGLHFKISLILIISLLINRLALL